MADLALGDVKVTTRRKREVCRVDELCSLADAALKELDEAIAELGSTWREKGECYIKIEVSQIMTNKES